MHPEADAFLDAIFDHPDDDTPRLVYADWLEEHGQGNYAQFIRLQCAAAREKLWSAEANRLWEEIGRVWNRLDEEWWPATRDVWDIPGLAEIWEWTADWQSKAVYRIELRRGLLDAVHFRRGLLRPDIPFTAVQALRYASCWPSIMTPDASLDIDCMPDGLVALAANPVLRHVRRVRLMKHWYAAHREQLLTFIRSPYLSRVRILALGDVYLEPPTIDALLSAENLSNVEQIHLWAAEEVLARFRERFPRVNST